MALTDQQRKERQRERDKQSGMIERRFKITQTQDERLNAMLEKRGYDFNEYVALLIHRDVSRFEESIKDLGDCPKCGQKKEFGSNCAFKGMANCWETIERKELTRL